MSEDDLKKLHRLLAAAAVSERLKLPLSAFHKQSLELAQILLKCLKQEAFIQDMNIHRETNPIYNSSNEVVASVSYLPVVTIQVKFTK